ncbi:MmgE/PrpD family protein [Mycobacterium sp. PS03-16]|uniref:MmgE/PrpD family protein n=1 Tax=Mycobacterium sp. PS03-16 TaxID=2559611 RepID=UPI0014308F66|nr:MmgE/PrpD family protein [Mycobacterium sp. PS03-16]
MRETQQLSEYIAGLKYEDLPPAVVEQAKIAIRDAMGVALYSANLPWTTIVSEFAGESGAAGPATLWGRSGSLSAPAAAMVNGTAAHGIEMDDRSAALDLHNGAPTIPAAIATAQYSGASGRELITAVVAGYEVAYRVARATQGGITRFYWVSIRSILGAATAAAMANRLDADGLVNTLGIVGSFASGLLAHMQESKGTMVKRLQGGGWPSQAGVTAALLAGRGFTGPSTILEGEFGICSAFSTEKAPRMEALVADLGGGFEITGWETKPYAAVGHLHSTIDAIGELRGRPGFEPGKVTAIEVACSTKITPNVDNNPPQSLMAAQRSLNFIAATALFHDLRDAGTWREDILEDKRLTSLVPNVTTVIDPEIEEIYRATNDHGGVRITVTMEDGSTHTAAVRHAVGTLANPMSKEQLVGKYSLLAERTLPAEQVHALSAWIDDLDQHQDLSGLDALVTPKDGK